MEANEYMLGRNKDDDDNTPASGGGKEEASKGENDGTLILDATCAPANIRYPQDVSLLNEAREKLEKMLWRFHKDYALELPRRYSNRARKDYLVFAKSKKHSRKKIRKAIRKQLGYTARDIRYLERFQSDGYALLKNEIPLYLTIIKLYEQQKQMYDNKVHSVEHRIVSITQPWLRPVVRGKAKAPAEFGAKLDLSIDSEGYGRIERISFEAYNESTCLIEAIQRFKERTGKFPKRVLVDQIYRTRENRRFCKENGIRLSGPKLGRPSVTANEDKKVEYQDNTDRIEVERAFSVAKRCYGMGLITTKLKETQLSSIALSVFVSNLFRLQRQILFALFCLLQNWSRREVLEVKMAD